MYAEHDAFRGKLVCPHLTSRPAWEEGIYVNKKHFRTTWTPSVSLLRTFLGAQVMVNYHPQDVLGALSLLSQLETSRKSVDWVEWSERICCEDCCADAVLLRRTVWNAIPGDERLAECMRFCDAWDQFEAKRVGWAMGVGYVKSRMGLARQKIHLSAVDKE